MFSPVYVQSILRYVNILVHCTCNMIITISGTPGAGKSTCAKILAEQLSYTYYGVGAMLRAKQGSPHVQSGDDRKIDSYTVDDNTVIDGRLAYHFYPNSFKVYLHCSVEMAAQRIYSDTRKSEEVASMKEAVTKVVERRDYDKQRYLKEYGIDYTDQSQYDLVIDTTRLSITETVALIHKTFNTKTL